MAQYKSNMTLFLEELKTQKPELEQAQQDGRALLWDQSPVTPERKNAPNWLVLSKKPTFINE